MCNLPSRLMIVATVGGLFLAATAPASADDALRLKIAKTGANLAGFNYQNYQYCGASPADLTAIKAKDQTKFAAAGSEFDASFAAGVADSVSKRDIAIAQLGEAKFKTSVCPNVLKDLQAKLVGR